MKFFSLFLCILCSCASAIKYSDIKVSLWYHGATPLYMHKHAPNEGDIMLAKVPLMSQTPYRFCADDFAKSITGTYRFQVYSNTDRAEYYHYICTMDNDSLEKPTCMPYKCMYMEGSCNNMSNYRADNSMNFTVTMWCEKYIDSTTVVMSTHLYPGSYVVNDSCFVEVKSFPSRTNYVRHDSVYFDNIAYCGIALFSTIVLFGFCCSKKY